MADIWCVILSIKIRTLLADCSNTRLQYASVCGAIFHPSILWTFIKEDDGDNPLQSVEDLSLRAIYHKNAVRIVRKLAMDNFIAALFTIAKTWKQPVSINRWMVKEDMVYIDNGLLLSHKKEWKLAMCNSMDGPVTLLT